MYLSPRVAGQLAIADAQGGPCDPRWPLDLSTFNFSDPAIIADPYPWYEQFRATQPVYRCELLGGAWLISRHEHIRCAFADRRLSSRRGGDSMRPLATRAPGLVQSLSDEFTAGWSSATVRDTPTSVDRCRGVSPRPSDSRGRTAPATPSPPSLMRARKRPGRLHGRHRGAADHRGHLRFHRSGRRSRASVVGWSDRLNEVFGPSRELSEPDLRCARASLDAFVDHLAGYQGTGLARWSACLACPPRAAT